MDSERLPEQARAVLRRSEDNSRQPMFWLRLEERGRRMKSLPQLGEFEESDVTVRVAVAVPRNDCDDGTSAVRNPSSAISKKWRKRRPPSSDDNTTAEDGHSGSEA